MTKKHFIALADDIKWHNSHTSKNLTPFTKDQLETLAIFCKGQNHAFDQERWFMYIAGKCGPNGGAVKNVTVTSGQ